MRHNYKILMLLLPFSSKSQRNVFMTLVEDLAERGHDIVMVSNNKIVHSGNPRIREIYHNLPYIDEDFMNMFEQRKNPYGVLTRLQEVFPNFTRDIYQIPAIMELYNQRKQFDLIAIDHTVNEMMYPFAHEMPFITVAVPGMDPRQSAVFGNPLNPAYVPNLGTTNPFGMTNAFGRLINVFQHMLFAFFTRNWALVPLIQKEISVIFPDLPPLLEIERNQSLTLLNSHFSMDLTLPLLPSQIEVGGMQCRPAKPLPEDINAWINGAGSAGVIYFSLGSIAKGNTIPMEYRDIIVKAFSKIKQRVLWKFESDLEGVSNNVMIKKWIPQQDVLAHPNVKVFMTHGGLLSLQEASYHSTPLLAFPIFADQPLNSERIVERGIGLFLIWEELTVDKIVNAIQEIISNPKYSENIDIVSKRMKDQMTTPVNRAVFWTEYAVRHKGAPKLRSPSADLSWVEFLLLDVMAIFSVISVIVLLMICWTVKKIVLYLSGQKTGNNNKNKVE